MYFTSYVWFVTSLTSFAMPPRFNIDYLTRMNANMHKLTGGSQNGPSAIEELS